MRSRLATLPRTVWILGLISLVNDGASDLIYPLLPLYLTSVLMAGPRALGLIEGIAEATASLLKLVSGILSDRWGRTRPWIIGGYGLAGVARPLIALASCWPLVMLLRFADRLGKGLRSSPRDALLAAAVTPEQMGLAFGLHRAMDNAGAVVGPLIAAGLLALHLSLRQIISWSLLPGIVCTALALLLREPQRSGKCQTTVHSGALVVASSTARRTSIQWHPSALPPGLRGFLLVAGLFTLGNASNVFLLLRASQLGVSAVQIPLLWAALSGVAMLGSAPLAGWSDRIGRRRLLVAGYTTYGLLYLLIGHLQRGSLWIWPLFAAYGLFLSATEGVEKALVADLALPSERGTAFGWFNLVTGLSLLPASLIFGGLMQGYGASAAFAVAAAFALAAAVLLALMPTKLLSHKVLAIT
ncbi:MAG: MFS transporter [Synechococcaceae bacterium WBA_2_066]|nr:MFS transporter [Synechococcaceae bacterium WB6_1B_055]NCY13432.1 MFS transporter [Synechococcaceae bacterium WB8_1A_041]NDC07587.1 MFS transporter [Synechococcaceae bacterium WB9_2_069]NDE38644.1 MFS transporter [Synechococcaceae bacterium WBA_2_066]